MKKWRVIFISVVIALLLFSAVVYGDTWTASKRLTNNVGDSYLPAIAVNGSNIYVVWSNHTQGNNEIYFKRSVNGGVTWTANMRLTNSAGDSYLPAIAVNGSNIYVVWFEHTPGKNEIYIKRSFNGGDTWTPDKRIITNAGDAYPPAIAVNGPIIYVIWSDRASPPDSPDLHFKQSRDGGATWERSKRITDNAGGSCAAAMAVDGSTLHVVWQDDTPGNNEIYFKRSVNGGVTWGRDKRLTNNSAHSYLPAIAVDGSNIYVVWANYSQGNYQLYLRRSIDGGDTWTPYTQLTNKADYSFYPAIAVNGSNVYVVWADDTPGNNRIYFKRSENRGVTWTTDTQLTGNANGSIDPAIAVNGSTIYLVWADDTPEGDFEINFMKGVLD